VSGRGSTIHGGTIIMGVTRAFSIRGVVVMGVGEVPVSCLLGEGRAEPPSPLHTMWNCLAESSVMGCHGYCVPL
jgi:hypothetical protein